MCVVVLLCGVVYRRRKVGGVPTAAAAAAAAAEARVIVLLGVILVYGILVYTQTAVLQYYGESHKYVIVHALKKKKF